MRSAVLDLLAELGHAGWRDLLVHLVLLVAIHVEANDLRV